MPSLSLLYTPILGGYRPALRFRCHWHLPTTLHPLPFHSVGKGCLHRSYEKIIRRMGARNDGRKCHSFSKACWARPWLGSGHQVGECTSDSLCTRGVQSSVRDRQSLDTCVT